MAYKRNWENSTRKTKVQLYWNAMSGAYSLKFENTYKWTQMQGVLTWIKQTIVWTEREYDVDTKTWFIHAKHIKQLKQLLDLLSNDFELDFIEKPEDQQVLSFTPVSVYKETFNRITQQNIDNLDADQAKKLYRKTCMLLHPDRNPGQPNIARLMSELNEAWSQLQIQHFKTKELVQQL